MPSVGAGYTKHCRWRRVGLVLGLQPTYSRRTPRKEQIDASFPKQDSLFLKRVVRLCSACALHRWKWKVGLVFPLQGIQGRVSAV